MNLIYKYPRLAVFILGALSNLALAPFEFLPVLMVTFPLFFKILNEDEKIKPFWLGWWFGFGYFVFGLYWISNSLLVDAERFAWMIPFAISLIPAILSIYIGGVAYAYKRYSGELSQARKILLFIALWVVAEVLRNYLFTGFPWNLIGYASLGFVPLAQYAAFVTVFGVSVIVLWVSFLPLLYRRKRYLTYLILVVVFGHFLSQPSYISDGKEVSIRIVQPNIEQTLRWDPELVNENFKNTLELAGKGNKDDFDLVILPEAAVPFHVNRRPEVVAALANIAPAKGYVITGGLRSEGGPRSSDYEVWNSLYVINSKAEIVAVYDKHHLVPFGEYVPFRDVLPIDKITPGAINFSDGPNVGSIKLPDSLSFNPLICYEIIFPQYGFSSAEYDFILNITNDGWFGDSSGPYQHLAMAKMRAIEQSRPVVRAANTGISAFISSQGDVVQSIELNESGVIDLEYYLNQ